MIFRDKIDFLIANLLKVLKPTERIPIVIELDKIPDPAKIRELEGYNFLPKYKSKIFNITSGNIEIDKLRELVKLGNIKHIFLDKKVKVARFLAEAEIKRWEEKKHVLVPSVANYINADKLYEQGYKGKGIRIAVLDTGVDTMHPVFVPDAIEKALYTITDSPDDYFGHGTHVCSTIAGRDTESPLGAFHGIAPESKLISIKILDDEGAGSDTSVIQGIELAVEEGVDIVNMSLGGYPSMAGLDAMSRTVDEASRTKNIKFCVAAGNSFLPYYGAIYGSVGTPGSSREAITVGACATELPYKDVRSEFSSKGPTSDLRLKPDISLPGGNFIRGFYELIYAAVPGGWAGSIGTSMATPSMSGALALFMNATNSSLTADEIKTLFFMSSRNDGPLKNNRKGFGVLDIAKMVDSYNTAKEEGIPLIPITRGGLPNLRQFSPIQGFLAKNDIVMARMSIKARDLIAQNYNFNVRERLSQIRSTLKF